jgi:replicative DNA helicase
LKSKSFSELPHSPEAEDAILGTLLANPEAIHVVAGLDPAAFYDPLGAAAFRAIQGLSVNGRALDPIAVYEQMRATDPATDSAALASLHELTEWRLSEKQLLGHVRIVLDHKRLRELARVGGEITALGYQRSDADKHIGAAQMLLAKLANVKSKRDPQHICESLAGYLDYLNGLGEGKSLTMSTGIGKLDELLNGGLRKGEVTVIGARPKHGKTALALAMARNLARQNAVLFLSQEMSITALMHRHTAAMGNFDLGAILRADPADQAMWQAVLESAERLGQLNLIHDEQCALTLHDIRRKAVQTKRVHGLDVMFVDFLQLMNGAGEENRNRELDVIVNGVKALAMDLDVAVVVLSQMSRDADKVYGRPKMTHLRDSGAIEAAADQVLLLFNDWAHPLSKKDKAFEGFSELEIVAHRNGPTGTVPMEFIGRYQQFGDWMHPLPQRSKGSDGFE